MPKRTTNVEIVKPEFHCNAHYNFFVDKKDGIDYFQPPEIVCKYPLLRDAEEIEASDE